MSEWTLWREGFLCTGMEGIPAKAEFLGSFEAETFSAAVDIWVKTLSEDHRKYINLDNCPPTDWGCAIYDNEAAARKFLG